MSNESFKGSEILDIGKGVYDRPAITTAVPLYPYAVTRRDSEGKIHYEVAYVLGDTKSVWHDPSSKAWMGELTQLPDAYAAPVLQRHRREMGDNNEPPGQGLVDVKELEDLLFTGEEEILTFPSLEDAGA